MGGKLRDLKERLLRVLMVIKETGSVMKDNAGGVLMFYPPALIALSSL